MTVGERASRILKLDELQLPPKPTVLQIIVEDYIDTTDVPSLRVEVLLDGATTDEELRAGSLQIKRTIRDRLSREGIDEFAYIRFATPSELAETDVED
jgi:hypothetical protein